MAGEHAAAARLVACIVARAINVKVLVGLPTCFKSATTHTNLNDAISGSPYCDEVIGINGRPRALRVDVGDDMASARIPEAAGEKTANFGSLRDANGACLAEPRGELCPLDKSTIGGLDGEEARAGDFLPQI